MIAVRLALLLPVTLSLILLHALPLLPKRSRLFGVDVAPEIRSGPEGARLMRRYQMCLLPFTVGAFLLITGWTFRPLLAGGGLAVAAFAAVGLVYRYHARAKPFAVPPPSIREASLIEDTGGLPRRLLWFAPPLVLLAAIALYLAAHWNQIPQTFPVHFDGNDRPNGWSHRTVRGVFGPLAFGALIVLFLSLLYIAMDLGSRRATRRSVMLAALSGPAYLIAALFSVIGLLPFFNPPVWLILVLVAGFFPVYLVLISHLLSKPLDGPAEVTPDRCWHGSFYYNPDDPALFVEARTGFGYAGNLARPLTWVISVVIFLFFAGLFLLARTLFG
jgi:uncharacterized membrane protein